MKKIISVFFVFLVVVGPYLYMQYFTESGRNLLVNNYNVDIGSFFMFFLPMLVIFVVVGAVTLVVMAPKIKSRRR